MREREREQNEAEAPQERYDSRLWNQGTGFSPPKIYGSFVASKTLKTPTFFKDMDEHKVLNGEATLAVEGMCKLHHLSC